MRISDWSSDVCSSDLLGDGEDRFVYIVDDQGKAQRTEVRTGARQDGRIEIGDGLSRGQKVVTDGIVKLYDGLTARVTKNAGAAGYQENMITAAGGRWSWRSDDLQLSDISGRRPVI